MNLTTTVESLLDALISYFEPDIERGRFANIPSQQTTLRRIASTKYYQPIIDAIQAEPDEVKQKELKKQLSAVTPVSLLRHRKKDTTFADKIIQQWPMMMGDVDKQDNPDVDMQDMKKFVCRLPYVLLCQYSVRGGVWFVVRLPDGQTPDTLAAHFRYLQKLFWELFEVKLDSTKGGNPTDLRFVSCDAEPHLNDGATIMQGEYTPLPPPKAERTYTHARTIDEGKLLSRIVQMVDSAGQGERHEKLLKAARLAGGYIAGGQLDEQNVVLGLETVASEWPNIHKSQGTIRDGIRMGKANPIYPEERTYTPTPPPRSQPPAPKPAVTVTPKPVPQPAPAPAEPDATTQIDTSDAGLQSSPIADEPPVTIRVHPPDEYFLTIRGIQYSLRGVIHDAERMNRLFWHYWVRPPFMWNRIKTHRQVLGWLGQLPP